MNHPVRRLYLLLVTVSGVACQGLSQQTQFMATETSISAPESEIRFRPLVRPRSVGPADRFDHRSRRVFVRRDRRIRDPSAPRAAGFRAFRHAVSAFGAGTSEKTSSADPADP